MGPACPNSSLLAGKDVKEALRERDEWQVGLPQRDPFLPGVLLVFDGFIRCLIVFFLFFFCMVLYATLPSSAASRVESRSCPSSESVESQFPRDDSILGVIFSKVFAIWSMGPDVW